MTATETKCPVDDVFCQGGDHSGCMSESQYEAIIRREDEEKKPLSAEQNARASIAAIEAAATWVADALNAIARLEDERALIKPQAIRRLMDSGAATSATAAEKIVEADPEYAAHREKQRDAEVVKWAAAAAYESAKLTAKLDVALATRGIE